MTDTKSLRTGAGYALGAGLYATHKAMAEAADTIDTLRAENERLKNEAAIFYEAAAGLLATNDALRDQLAKAQRDAERYNFLAGFNLTVHSPRWGHWHIERWTKDGWEPIYGNLMSAAIDAAKGDSNAS